MVRSIVVHAVTHEIRHGRIVGHDLNRRRLISCGENSYMSPDGHLRATQDRTVLVVELGFWCDVDRLNVVPAHLVGDLRTILSGIGIPAIRSRIRRNTFSLLVGGSQLNGASTVSIRCHRHHDSRHDTLAIRQSRLFDAFRGLGRRRHQKQRRTAAEYRASNQRRWHGMALRICM